MEIAPGIRRLGNGLVNVYLLEEAGEITIVDAGAPGQWKELLGELEAMGRTLDDVRAVVLTHGHSDHIGFAERARRALQVPVSVHELDQSLATGAMKPIRDHETKAAGMKIGAFLGFLAYSVRKGMLRIPRIEEVATFGDGATLDVPGAPRVILVPGHTAGSAALHVPAREVVFVGDAFATRSALSGATGPLTVPQFNADTRQALASLDRLVDLDARLALPGHGEPWRGDLAEAVQLVRASVPSLASTAA